MLEYVASSARPTTLFLEYREYHYTICLPFPDPFASISSASLEPLATSVCEGSLVFPRSPPDGSNSGVQAVWRNARDFRAEQVQCSPNPVALARTATLMHEDTRTHGTSK